MSIIKSAKLIKKVTLDYKKVEKKEHAMIACEKTACKWSLKQNNPVYQVKETPIVLDDRSEG